MGRKFLKLKLPIDFPDSVTLVKSLYKSSVFSREIVAQMHLKPTLLSTIPLLNDLGELFLIKFTADNLVFSSFKVYVGGFLEEIATISKISSANCGL